MPYSYKKVGNKTCVYKKSTGKKVGCTSGPVNKYLAALHMHDKNESVNENIPRWPQSTGDADPNYSVEEKKFFAEIPGAKPIELVTYTKLIASGKTPEEALAIVKSKHNSLTENLTRQLKESIKSIVIKEKLKEHIRGIINEINDYSYFDPGNKDQGLVQTVRKSTLTGKDAVDLLVMQYNVPRNFARKVVDYVVTTPLNEEKESPVVRNIKSVENFDALLAKPENAGSLFTQQEMDAVNRMEVKPTKKTPTELQYGTPEEMSGKNKDLVIRKIKGKYVGFFSLRAPIDVSPDVAVAPGAEVVAEADEATPEEPKNPNEPQKDEVFIIVSRPLTNTMKDITMLSNFILHLINEYQIT